MNKTLLCRILAAAALFVIPLSPALAAEQWDVFETTFTFAKKLGRQTRLEHFRPPGRYLL